MHYSTQTITSPLSKIINCVNLSQKYQKMSQNFEFFSFSFFFFWEKYAFPHSNYHLIINVFPTFKIINCVNVPP
jgi:hypothetical protein